MVAIFSDIYACLFVTLAFILCTFAVVEHFGLILCDFGFTFTFVNGHTCFCFIHVCSVLFILVICGVPCLSVCLIAIVSFWALLQICCSQCRSKDFDFDVLMMPYDHDVLMPYEHALLKLRSRQKSKRFKIHHQEDL